MTPESNPSTSLFIGWDVGGWNCDRNANSRDALVVLDSKRNILGRPWRGNLRLVINGASSTEVWIQALLDCCQVDLPGNPPPVVLAIDTPLGFSEQFRQLISGQGMAGPIEGWNTNPYLFRHSELFLFQRGLTPLSPVKDMIGSQATKGMHALARFASESPSIGVWTNGTSLTAIEAYPAGCKPSPLMRELLRAYRNTSTNVQTDEWAMEGFGFGIDHEDKRDALLCALVAWLHYYQPEALCPPEADTPAGEGWIFVPRDALAPA
ncbi:DUF429 domain-containing protein [Microbulbifer agarilyticus]|uniref:DUF429 domain-containing protein n=1 Tax=Microbulbifer agarilyticus TaxID=260552 RepID=UPI001C9491EE|nr:DUF429 domain-containing protein [Microbulbifer agarilyticus]MBY6212367.1 DUF429 domain-containing protein [Microbulbifer agarilyticus]